jgi:glycosyltransferase involved in cell wall biosynthesis
MRRKVTYLTTGLARAGAETELILLCREFVQAGWDVGVISMLPPGAYVQELQQLGVPLECLDVRKGVPDPRAFWRLMRTLRSWSPDVLHCHQVHANLAGRLARIFTRIPVVICTSHCTYEGPRWREWAYRLTDPLCDLTTCVCQAGVDRYVEVGCAPAEKICFMPNAVDVERFTPAKGTRERVRKALGLAGEFTWLAVGHLRISKDYPTMLQAFRKVCAESPAARLLIAGCGPLGEALARQAREMGLDGPVRFLGIREDVPELMAAADGLLMSSRYEGTPLAILEAGASGLPVVATRVGGNAEVIVDGTSGVLVESGDPAALAGACLRVMRASPEERAELARRARRRVETAFSLEVVVDKWQQLYSRVWQQTQRGSLAREMA